MRNIFARTANIVRKKTSIVLAVIMAVSCLLSGCGPEPGESDSIPPMFGEDGAATGMTGGKGPVGEPGDVLPPGGSSIENASAGDTSSASAGEGSSHGAAESFPARGGLPVNLKEMSAGDLTALEAYLNELGSYGFLLSTYETAADIDLDQVFYAGAGFKQTKLEDKEKELLYGRISVKSKDTPIVKVTEEQIDDLLTSKAGITYEESNHKLDTEESWAHIGRYNAWYSVHGDSNRVYIDCSDAWMGGDICIVHYRVTDDFPAHMESSADNNSEKRTSEESSSAGTRAEGESKTAAASETSEEAPSAGTSAGGESKTAAASETSEEAPSAGTSAGGESKTAAASETSEEALSAGTSAGGESKTAAASETSEEAPSAGTKEGVESNTSASSESAETANETEKDAGYRPVYEALLKKTDQGWQFISNILWIQRNLIETQSYRAELDPVGEVFFAPVYPDTSVDPMADVSFVLVQNKGLLAVLPNMEARNIRTDRIFKSVESVDFTDYNGDGCTDIIAVCNYTKMGTDGKKEGELTEARVYKGRKSGIPSLDKKKTEDVNKNVETLNISCITAYLTGKTDGKDKKYQSWKEAFADHIRNIDEKEYDGFALIYLNDDRVPELVQVGATSAKGATVVVYKGGALTETWLNRRQFQYLEYENLLLSASGVENLHYDSIYGISGGKLRVSVQGYYGNNSFARVQYDKNGKESYDYMWDGGSVSGSGYMDGIFFVFDASRAKKSDEEQLLSAEEMLKKLQ